ncbi:MAG TPA: tetratricopeptide repeat protein [Candidatus Udaeobacter sp.]|nr:tetratricopeptide repeat protein [Candidatus Udaeobacter sp.]
MTSLEGTKALPAGILARAVAYLQREWVVCAILAICGFVVHAPALQGEFVWDDQYLAHDNPFIKSPLLILEAFRHHLFLDSFSAHYRPVQNLSFIFDYAVWNTNTYGFHLTNVLLHLTSGFLLFLLLRKLFLPWDNRVGGAANASLAAFLVTLLWIVHPVHSAAVDYISGRADSLAFAFACSAWLLAFRAQEARTRSWRILFGILALVCGLLALCAREIACVWCALFLVHTLVFNREASARFKVVSLGCCVALLLSYAGLRHLPEQRPAQNPSSEWSPSTRAVLMLRALGDYGRLMVLPTSLHMERSVIDPNNYRTNLSWRESVKNEYLSILGLAVATAMGFGCIRKTPGRLMRVFGATWFVAGYLPISNIIELNATVAEHWLYLPSVGFLIFLAGCAIGLPATCRKAAVTLACFAVIGLGIRSAIRSSDWLTPETFYRRTLAAGGMTARIGVNLAQIYANRGEYAKAESIYRRVLAMVPDYPIARTNLAEILYRQGKKAEAEAILVSTTSAAVMTRKEYPRTWIAALNLARVHHDAKNDTQALAILERARTDYPHTWEIISFEAEILRLTKGPGAALDLVQHFTTENWWHHGASIALGRLYFEAGALDRASAAFRHASLLDVHDVEALNLIATMNIRQNHLEEAWRAQRRAVARQPDEPRQYAMLSNILEKMGRTDEARSAMAQVSRLQALARSPQPIVN